MAIAAAVLVAAPVAFMWQLPAPPEPKIKKATSAYTLVLAPGPPRFERTDINEWPKANRGNKADNAYVLSDPDQAEDLANVELDKETSGKVVAQGSK